MLGNASTSDANIPTRLVAPKYFLTALRIIYRRFIVGCDFDIDEAKRRWDITRNWRELEGVDTILSERQPLFFTIKVLPTT